MARRNRYLRGELRALRALWWREILRLSNNRIPMAMMLVNPLLFLLILGTGLGSMTGSDPARNSYQAYLFPGVLLMAVQMPALGAGMSIVRDREAGLLRGVLVAPVARSTLLIGKCLGSATAAALLAAVLLAFAGTAGIPYDPLVLLALLAELGLISLTLTAFVALAAVWIRRMEVFQSLLAMAMLPLFFLSGALFSVQNLPGWLSLLTLANPLTYAVDLLRQTVALSLAEGVMPAGPQWLGQQPPLGVQILVMSVLGVAALSLAATRFSRPQ